MVAQPDACLLCGLPAPYPIHNQAGQTFCCPACCEVHELLADFEAGDSPPMTAVPSPTETASATLSLGGLWCPSCSWLIQESLRRTEGIHTVDVNFIQREARVRYDPACIEPRKMTRQVKRLGYRAWLPGDKPYDDEEAHWNRLLISGVLVMHVMIISFILYARDWLGWSSPETEWLADIFNLMSLAASVPVIFILGFPILRAGVASLLRRRPNIHTLIALGAFSAFILSIRNLIVGYGRVYFDTTAVLLFLVAVGRWLEMRAHKKSRQAVERLYDQMPTEATHKTATGDESIPADQIRTGMRLRVRPGTHFPVDGVVATGQGDVDESLLTGEPVPVLRQVGDAVHAGTINLDGAFEVLATAVGVETLAGQIGRLLHQALWQRSPIERLADRWAAWMTPAAALIASATFAFWALRVDVDTGLIYALSVLLIACPCALGIATPLTLWLGLTRASTAGILLRNTGVLEKLANVQQIFFDKTGTLTQRPMRLQMVATDGIEEAKFLNVVRTVEAYSEHPLAQAIIANSKTERPHSLPPHTPATDFRALPGLGVTGCVANAKTWIGSRRLMEEQGLTLSPALQGTVDAWQQQGLAVIYAGWEERVQGVLALGETIRSETMEMLKELTALDLKVTILTGDDKIAGERWQRLLGVPVLAELHPEEKLRQLTAVNTDVVMVGDGINDGPALAAATVGIAVAQGTDVAQAAAEVILLDNDLRAIPWLISLSKTAMRKVRQNLAWAFFYNLFGLSLAVTGYLEPAIAALLMVLSNAVVTSNALTLRNFEANGWRIQDAEEQESEEETFELQPAVPANLPLLP